jgi:hypothetical protein
VHYCQEVKLLDKNNRENHLKSIRDSSATDPDSEERKITARGIAGFLQSPEDEEVFQLSLDSMIRDSAPVRRRAQ